MLLPILSLLLHFAAADTDALIRTKAAGVPVEIIRANLSNPKVQIGVAAARGVPHGAESFQQLLSRSKLTAAVNGAYFSKSTLEPIGDIVIGGRLVNRGWMGTALAVSKTHQVSISRVRRGFGEDWTGYETVLACGPALVLHGKIDVQPQMEGFQDPHVMGSTARMGIGITTDNHLLLVHARSAINFTKWAEVMLALHCRDAMNLDAGASLAMYYRGKILHSPGRHLTNILGIYVDRSPPAPNILSAVELPQVDAPAPKIIPANSNEADAVNLKLCSETLGRATIWCPATLQRRISRKKIPRFCLIHHPPAGE